MADWVHWTFAEMTALRTLRARGWGYADIAKAIPGRSEAACISKAHKLGLPVAPRDADASHTRQAQA